MIIDFHYISRDEKCKFNQNANRSSIRIVCAQITQFHIFPAEIMIRKMDC